MEQPSSAARVLDVGLDDGLDRNPIDGLFPSEVPVRTLDDCINEVEDELPSSIPLLVRKGPHKAGDIAVE